MEKVLFNIKTRWNVAEIPKLFRIFVHYTTYSLCTHWDILRLIYFAQLSQQFFLIFVHTAHSFLCLAVLRVSSHLKVSWTCVMSGRVYMFVRVYIMLTARKDFKLNKYQKKIKLCYIANISCFNRFLCIHDIMFILYFSSSCYIKTSPQTNKLARTYGPKTRRCDWSWRMWILRGSVYAHLRVYSSHIVQPSRLGMYGKSLTSFLVII